MSGWHIKGIYFEACNCESVCPCYSTQPPTYAYCEGPCIWHVTQGAYGAVALDDLNVIMLQRTEGFMRVTPWHCWFYVDERALDAQYAALEKIFSLQNGGHLAKTFGHLWDIRGFQRAQIEIKLDGWQHRASILGKLGVAVGLLQVAAGPTLCRVPNVPGVAALAAQDWFVNGELKFDHKGKNALSTTFDYSSDG